jgi:hypothetical protein
MQVSWPDESLAALLSAISEMTGSSVANSLGIITIIGILLGDFRWKIADAP